MTASRNATLYPWYVAFLNGFYWFPVFFLFLTERVGVAGALTLESIYYATVVALEVPSGYVSDRFGRRLALRVAMACLTLSYAAFYLGESFASLAVAQCLLATGYAFNSGTDTAFHYDSLAAAGLEDEYADREERVARLSFAMVAVSAVVGGAVGSLALKYAYGIAFLSGIAGFGVTLAFRAPETAQDPGAERFDRQIAACVRELRHPVLAWVFAFTILLTVLIHVPYQFYQPYIALSDFRLSGSELPTPLLTGLHACGAMVVASWLSGRSVRWARRFGIRFTALAGMAIVVGVIALMGLVLHPLVVVVLLMRSAPRALTMAPMNAIVTPRIPGSMRASYLSVQSLAGRLSFSGLLLALSFVATTSQPSWADISRMCLVSAGVGFLGLVGLALNSRVMQSAFGPESVPPAS